MKRAASVMTLTILLSSMSVFACNVRFVRANGTIYIRANGSVDPPTAPIQRNGDVYTFTDNAFGEVALQKSNIVVDGAGYTLQGSGDMTHGFGVYSGTSNVTIRNTNIKDFYIGIVFESTSNNMISGNNITNNDFGVWLYLSSCYNIISGNNITANSYYGVWVDYYSSYNTISGNAFTNDGLCVRDS